MSTEKNILLVEGMSCGHCKNAVEKAVGALAGVSLAEVDLAEKTLAIEFDASRITLDKIKEIVDEEGYTVIGKK
ncbi:MAG: Heavy metal transport/detoxification protein [Pelosinus sp.]|jgi:copper chaperone|nr:Heavy metal transport/detoxification protein [Pelosinus sp.]